MLYNDADFDSNLIRILKDSKGNDGKHSCYQECCDHAETMSWHMYGEKPVTLLKRTRPREDPDVTTYRLENYEPTTKSAADKALNIVGKIFNPNIYSIRWEKSSDSAKKLQKYTLEEYPQYNSVVNFTKDVLLRKMIADPNGVVAIKIDKLPEKSSDELRPKIFIYGSSAIYNFDDDHYLIFTSKDTVKPYWSNFEYFDKNKYISFRAYVTPQNKLVKEEVESYPYNFGRIPVWKLQGNSESEDNGTIIYKSFFDSAVPFWNLSIIHESDVLAAYINHMHPLRYELSEPCNYVMEGRFKCKGGFIQKDTGEKLNCPKCEGSGYKPAGPYGVYKISKEKLQEGDTPVGIDPVGYINVPTEATKMLEERAERMRDNGMWAINMDVEEKVGEVQSGVAKAIDRSAQYDTLYNIGTVVFDYHLTNIYDFMNAYMFGVSDQSIGKNSDDNLPQINKPTQFDIASTAELVNNYKIAKDSGLDPNYLQIKQIEIQSRDLTTNPDLKKFTTLILNLDPLPSMDAITISANVAKGFVRNVDAVIHFNLKRFVERAIRENKTFYEMDMDKQVVVLEGYANEYITQNKPKVDQTLLMVKSQQQQSSGA